jgi:hypothetical protein
MMNTDPIKDFMSRVVPWPSNGEGYINLHWLVPSRRDPAKKVWLGKPFTNVDDFLSFARWAASSGRNITDIYYCTSQQSTAGKTKAGKDLAIRNAANAKALKALFIDVDVKEPPKGYKDQADALANIGAFVRSCGLLFPTFLVSSGSGGVHVYWVSDRPLPVDEWRQYAEGLKAAALSFGLRCDAGVTTDAARVLRVPGTKNYKTEPPGDVRLLGARQDLDFQSSTLAKLKGLAPAKSTPKASTNGFDPTIFPKKPPVKDELGAGIDDVEYPPLPLAPIISECAFLRTALDTGGREFTQPLWNLTTLAQPFSRMVMSEPTNLVISILATLLSQLTSYGIVRIESASTKVLDGQVVERFRTRAAKTAERVLTSARTSRR